MTAVKPVSLTDCRRPKNFYREQTAECAEYPAENYVPHSLEEQYVPAKYLGLVLRERVSHRFDCAGAGKRAEDSEEKLLILTLPKLIIKEDPDQINHHHGRDAPDKGAEKSKARPVLELQPLAVTRYCVPDRDGCANNVGGKNKNVHIWQ